MRTLGLFTLTAILVSSGLAQDPRPTLSGSSLIDHWIKAKWDELGLKPGKRADDAEYLRRLHLDLVGTVPALAEAEKFLEDKGSDKRARLVEALLKDKRYAEHWSEVWFSVLIGYDGQRQFGYGRGSANRQFGEMLEQNLPYDEFARRVITIESPPDIPEKVGQMTREKNQRELFQMFGQIGIENYIVKLARANAQDLPKALAGKVTRAFMGVQIQCAQCHDHPFDKWTQEEFYGMASFFTQTTARPTRTMDNQQGPFVVPPDGARSMGRRPGGFGMRPGGGLDLTIPDSKSGPIKPAFIDTGKGAVEGEMRRKTFARYMTDKENLQFARMAVNRTWAHFFGAGLVNPVDDFNGRNKPTHPELLDAVAKDFIAHGYDVHWLIKAIAGSQAYGLSSRAVAKDADPKVKKFFAEASVRALSPEQILRSVVTTTGGLDMSRRMGEGRGPMGPGGPGGMGFLAGQFRYAFGDDESSEVTEFTGSIPSALLMMNSEIIGRATSAQGGSLAQILEKHASPEARLRAIFVTVLSRPPTSGEMSRWKAHAGCTAGREGYEDVYWTLLNTSEFLFNH